MVTKLLELDKLPTAWDTACHEANRDAAFTPQPEHFDMARVYAHSMGFGAGAHACQGAEIAIEMVAACADCIRAAGRFDTHFGRQRGFRPLSNARIPLSEN